MLRFNLKRVLELRGVERPYSWLVRNGFVPATASNWARNQIGYVKPEQIERLCLLLNCTPNDLFEWRDDGRNVLAETHALRSLARGSATRSVSELARDIPADKLEKMIDTLADWKAEPAGGDPGASG